MNTTIITTKKNTASTKSVYFTFNFFEQTIVGKDVDFELAGNPSTAQYTQLMERMAIQPTFKLSPVETEKKVKRTYAGLTRELMAEYLEIKKEAVYKNALESLRQMKKDEVGYPAIKSWFLDMFPHFNVEQAKKEIRASRLQGAKAKYTVIVRKPNTTIELPAAANQ